MFPRNPSIQISIESCRLIVGAFNPSAILGGAAGITVKEAMRYGVARGLFSNEAGMGSTPHAHAVAEVDKPQDQGAVAIFSVFLDTFIVLTITALVILSTDSLGSGATGVAVLAVIFVVIGSTLKVDLVWNLSDLFNGVMVFPNLIALLALSGVVVAISKGKYDK